MVAGLHERGTEIIHPYFRAPVTYRHKNLRELHISDDAINRAQMSLLPAQPITDFYWLFELLVGHDNGSPLSTDQEL